MAEAGMRVSKKLHPGPLPRANLLRSERRSGRILRGISIGILIFAGALAATLSLSSRSGSEAPSPDALGTSVQEGQPGPAALDGAIRIRRAEEPSGTPSRAAAADPIVVVPPVPDPATETLFIPPAAQPSPTKASFPQPALDRSSPGVKDNTLIRNSLVCLLLQNRLPTRLETSLTIQIGPGDQRATPLLRPKVAIRPARSGDVSQPTPRAKSSAEGYGLPRRIRARYYQASRYSACLVAALSKTIALSRPHHSPPDFRTNDVSESVCRIRFTFALRQSRNRELPPLHWAWVGRRLRREARRQCRGWHWRN